MVWQNKNFIKFTPGGTNLPLCLRKLMDVILFSASLWTGHLRIVTLGNSWNIHITQDFTFKIVKVSRHSNFEVCRDSGMENFGWSDLTAYNEKEGKNKYVY
jgi:hypothetical protein